MLDWRDGRTPVSLQFDDIYFAVEGGLEESRYIFLSQNDLPKRFLESPVHRIAELGFGTGLNFLATLDSFQKQLPSDHGLEFWSCEKYPLTKTDLQKALQHWPELKTFSEALLELYPDNPSGTFEFEFQNFNTRLKISFCDVELFLENLRKANTKIDTWYFDGFSPKKNPEMWSESVFKKVSERSSAQSQFATFACAGFVKRGLIAAGFKIEKVKGFGKKREMLRGRKIED